jgi:small conductance mechanosensitive channel
MDNFMDTLVAFATGYGIKIVGAILLLIIGRMVASFARRLARKVLTNKDVDPMIVSFVGGLLYYLILIFTVIGVLNNFGVQTASLVAVLGAAGFAIGLALQGSLANFAAGIMLLIFRPFKIGDYVEVAGTSGSVRETGLFTTVLTTPDNIKILVPNGKVFGDIIKNVTAFDTRRVDLVVGIAYDARIDKAVTVINNLLKGDPRVLDEPAPMIAVGELADSSVNLIVRPWVKTSDYWPVRLDMTRQLKEAFDENGIEIPFPQVVVHKA